MITIYNPIFLTDTYARISISDWNFNREPNDEVEIVVMKGNEIAGKSIISKKNWIKTAKLVEEKVKLRPTEPMKFYYNDLVFLKEKSEDEKLEEFSKQVL